MEIQVYRLREAMDLIGPIVPRKATLEVLTHVLVADGRAVATDLEVTVTVELPGAEGQCVFPYQAVADLLKRVPGDEVLAIEQEGKLLRLAWADGKAVFETETPDAYPAIPEVEAVMEHRLDGDILVPAMVAVSCYCADPDDSRPAITGVFLGFGDTTEVAAADGFRLAWQTVALTFPQGIESVIIPATSVRQLARLLDKSPRTPPATGSLVALITAKREMELRFNETMLQARIGPVSLITRLLQGSFPKYHQLIPKDINARLGIMASELERAVRQVAGMAKGSNGIVRFAWSDSTMRISAKSIDVGEVETTIPVFTESEPGNIAINVKYLLGYLQGKDGLVTMEVVNSSSPTVFRYGRSPAVALMPMHVAPEPGDPPAETEEVQAGGGPEGEEENQAPEKPKRRRKPAAA